jgi:hypothetical protein
VARYKLRKGVAIGSLAAENDGMLSNVFVDAGYLERLSDASEGAFLILGRAGSGKTALIRKLKEQYKHVVQLDPEELSMQYLQNSVLKTVAGWGVNLEIFYKYLWRHICILELIRMRYDDANDVPSAMSGFLKFIDPNTREFQKTRELSRSYLLDYGDSYWVKTDSRVKAITSEVEKKLKSDVGVSASLDHAPSSIEAKAARGKETRTLNHVETEIVERAQQIVSDFQIADLNRVVDALGKNGFTDPQNPYLIVIDDLDKNWMPDDSLYLDLVKSLLFTVRELNYRLDNAKIIVALREDISHRVFQLRSPHEPQREKWSDVQIKVRWSKEQLVQMVDNRLAEVYRGEYTQAAPTLADLLPQKRKRPGEDEPIDYLIERTLMRPRDVIDFLNRCFDQTSEMSRLSLADLRSADVGYSEARLNAILDEWDNSYLGLRLTFPLLTKLGCRFTPSDITEEDLMEILLDDRAFDCRWLKDLSEEYTGGPVGITNVKNSLIGVWYLVGLIGVKDSASHRTHFSLDRALNAKTDLEPDSTFIVLKMLRSALGISEKHC